MNKKIHFIGIKGVGMAALAVLAKEMGYEVSGSDKSESFVTDELLRKAAIEVKPFDIQNLKGKLDFVVCSAAYGKDNVEVNVARKKHLEIKTYSEVLGLFSREKQVIAVAGIHGKTTTTAIISWLLTKGNLDPSFVIGAGEVKNLGACAHAGGGDYFVLEADEYRKSVEDSSPKFLDLTPKIEIISSIEMDHPDIFPSEESVYNAFYKFACRVPRNGSIILDIDYPKARKLERSLVDRNFETYGFSETARWQIVDVFQTSDETTFTLNHEDEKIGPFKLSIPGEANILNATAAVITCLKIGLEIKLIKKYLAEFLGVKRRFEKIGQVGEITILDDYAHHPRSIRMTLDAVRKKYPGAKVWCIFQPHTYSRTKKLLDDFAQSFRAADKVIITEIFASEREKEGAISGQDLALAIKKNNAKQRSVRFIADWSKIEQEIIDSVSSPTVIITIGAGDIYKLAEKVIKGLHNG